jgi:two-component system cell cycle response regulator DivK
VDNGVRSKDDVREKLFKAFEPIESFHVHRLERVGPRLLPERAVRQPRRRRDHCRKHGRAWQHVLARVRPERRVMAAQILVVDDNRDNLELMRFLLSVSGYDVALAQGGAEAIRLAAEQPIDLVLMDIQMPGIGGYEAAAAIRALPSGDEVSIVAVTAFAMVGDRDQVLGRGFDGYITKPIAPTTFIAQVEDYLPAHRRTGRSTRGGA